MPTVHTAYRSAFSSLNFICKSNLRLKRTPRNMSSRLSILEFINLLLNQLLNISVNIFLNLDALAFRPICKRRENLFNWSGIDVFFYLLLDSSEICRATNEKLCANLIREMFKCIIYVLNTDNSDSNWIRMLERSAEQLNNFVIFITKISIYQDFPRLLGTQPPFGEWMNNLEYFWFPLLMADRFY